MNYLPAMVNEKPAAGELVLLGPYTKYAPRLAENKPARVVLRTPIHLQSKNFSYRVQHKVESNMPVQVPISDLCSTEPVNTYIRLLPESSFCAVRTD